MRLSDGNAVVREEWADAVSGALGLEVATVKASMDRELAQLEARVDSSSDERWYASVEQGAPDYGIYESPEYMLYSWPGTVLFARPTLKYVVKHVPASAVRYVVDLGCGIGYTTSVLAREYPHASVYGTNVEGTQARVCRLLAERHRWSLVPDARAAAVDADATLAVASEYFEHFHRPVEHLREVLAGLGRPRWFAIANAFGARSAGHFPEYADGARSLSPRGAGRLFGDTMRAAGYTRAGSGWNGRPTLWMRA